MSKYCPYCGSSVEEDSIYCLNCGKKLPESVKSTTKDISRWESTPIEPTYRGVQPSPVYNAVYQPSPYHPSMKADIFERCIALFIDNCISGLLSYICIGVFYQCFKDGIRDGRSIGKGLFNLRVVDYQTGLPASYGQSFLRNCLCGWIDGCCCYLTALIDKDGRRIGDQIAGTVVIKDI